MRSERLIELQPPGGGQNVFAPASEMEKLAKQGYVAADPLDRYSGIFDVKGQALTFRQLHARYKTVFESWDAETPEFKKEWTLKGDPHYTKLRPGEGLTRHRRRGRL